MTFDSATSRHLVTVWNPAYGTDVMELHIRLLADRASRFRDGSADEESVYIWWGRIRSVRRQDVLPHLSDVLALEKELGESGGEAEREMQLYITDYRSLHVAHVGEITADDPREFDEDVELHVPQLYRQEGINCDCWFKVWDIRRLVSDDTVSVVEELSKLRNVAYHDMPVSIYGGMVNLPLIVTRPDGARYFESDVRQQLIGSQYWVEFDSEHSGIGATEREIREYCFGEEAWAKLDPGARTFIATAEKLYRDHRNDVAFDFSPVLLGFAKAFEVQTNILIKRALEGMRSLDRTVNIEGRSVDVVQGGLYGLGSLAIIIGENENINRYLKQSLAKPGGEWFTSSLPPILKQLAVVRNPAAHSTLLDRDTVRKQRDQFLGVGCEGDLVRLAKVRLLQQRGS